jgi:hypothetical protein
MVVSGKWASRTREAAPYDKAEPVPIVAPREMLL